MRVCLICEGSYPYVPRGTSEWMELLISQNQDLEFIVWALATTEEEMPEYMYSLPENVTAVETLYLGEPNFKGSDRKTRLTQEEKKALKGLIIGPPQDIDWAGLKDLTTSYRDHLNDLLTSASFVEIGTAAYKEQHSQEPFMQFLANLQQMYAPILFAISQEIPDADVYHAVSTGYAGFLGSYASKINGKPLVLSERGNYTAEREKDIIQSRWVSSKFKSQWMDFFEKLAQIAYEQASVVTTLSEAGRKQQIELGCPSDKIVVIPNGVDPDAFETSREKEEGEPFIVGAILRVVPSKDVKTLILAFDIVKREIPEAQLLILGNFEEDPAYFEECLELQADLGTQDVEFMGPVDVNEELQEVDLVLLSSLNESQPLAILEGMAAGKPIVATNVGECKALLEGAGPEDQFGTAGIVVPVMDNKAMAKAILRLIRNPELARSMGKAGRRRVDAYYRSDDKLEAFRHLYDQLGEDSLGRDRIRA